jgi:hypothetical protein
MPDPHVLSGDTISDAAPLQVTEGTGNPAHYLSGDLIDDDHPLQVVQVETLQTVPDVLDLTDQGSTPSAPAAGHTVVYSESGRLYQRAHGGAAIELTNSGDLGDLPTDDQKAALDANTSLSAENPVASMGDLVTQCANQAAIAPVVTAADTAFNALRLAMIASGLMAADPA